MSYTALIHERRSHIHFLTLNRPEHGNSLTQEMAAEFEEACRSIAADDGARAVVITGAGAQFSTGYDLEFGEQVPDDTEPLLRLSPAVSVTQIECPVIAAINGDALGAGLALALACDLRIASETSRFAVPDVSQGCLFGSGITQFLPRIVGKAKALEMALTAQSLEVQEALRIGLVHQVVASGEAFATAEKMAEDFANRAPLAMRYVKEALNKGMDLTLPQALRLECDLYMILHTTQDRVEGITAFRTKRPPVFKGE